MEKTEKNASGTVKTVIASLLALYVLFPFYLVVINSCKTTDDIIANPIGLKGISITQLFSNLSDVINNTHFLFWSAFGSSLVITGLSLLLLSVCGGMAAWVHSDHLKRHVDLE